MKQQKDERNSEDEEVEEEEVHRLLPTNNENNKHHVRVFKFSDARLQLPLLSHELLGTVFLFVQTRFCLVQNLL